MTFPFAKGHGTGNDFIVLPDLDGTVHGDLDPDLVRLLCDRRAGIGADGVLRVVRGDVDGGAGWFMDHRNADGSISQMCGNGIRVFARYLAAAELVDQGKPLAVDTRDGVKNLLFCDDGEISVDMGVPEGRRQVNVEAGGRIYGARSITMGNPNAVVFVSSLEDPGDLLVAPSLILDDFPHGANVEFVVKRGPAALAMRVYERGVGETQSCGTGACAAVVAAEDSERTHATYTVDVPGGRLSVTWDDTDHCQLKGPAVLVAAGVWTG